MFFRALIAFLVFPGIAGIVMLPLNAAFDPWRGAAVWLGLHNWNNIINKINNYCTIEYI